MPFTVSHVAAVLPFGRWLRPRRMLAAAAIGAMVPDFGVLLPFWVPRYESHGRLALLTFCLPLGLATWMLFEVLVRPALLQIVPDGWRARWRERGAVDLGSWRNWAMAAGAVLAGAVTHLAWDAFTHEDARGVQMFPVLDHLSWNVHGHPMHLYRLLQHLSSVLGLAVVLWAAWRWYSVREPATPTAPARRLAARERWAWCAAYLALPAIATSPGTVLALFGPEPLYASGALLARVAEAALASMALALLVVSLLVLLRVRLRH